MRSLSGHDAGLLDTDTAPRNADSMGVLIDWPGEAAAPQKFVFLVSESRPPACAQEALAAEQAAREQAEVQRRSDDAQSRVPSAAAGPGPRGSAGARNLGVGGTGTRYGNGGGALSTGAAPAGGETRRN